MKMKNLFNRVIVAVLGLSLVVSCSEPDNVIYDVFDGLDHGAILRTIEVTSANYDLADLESKFEVSLEEQDEKYGDLFESVNVYITYTDQFTDDPTDYSQAEALLKNVPASSFTTSSRDLPMATISVTLGEVISAFGLTSGQYNAGDLIYIRFEVVLTDGRSFSVEDGSGTLQGSYFASPYAYTAAILCKPMPGDYLIDMHDTYGDGWQTNDGNGGNGIQISLILEDGSEAMLEVGMCSLYQVDYPDCEAGDGYEAQINATIPDGAQSAEWYFPGDTYGEISFEIYAPTGEILFASGAPGATGSGSLPVVKCAL
jgi:hypothetical protein